jgi:hypothetical protein
MKKFSVLLCVALASCGWADDLGQHMPTIGERCDNWQCFTEGGREQSKMVRRARTAPPQGPQQPQPAQPPQPMLWQPPEEEAEEEAAQPF